MRYIVGVPEVRINWKAVETDAGVEAAIADAYENSKESIIEELDEDSVYSHTLESDEFKIRLPNGDEVSSEEAIDLEGSGERVCE